MANGNPTKQRPRDGAATLFLSEHHLASGTHSVRG